MIVKESSSFQDFPLELKIRERTVFSCQTKMGERRNVQTRDIEVFASHICL